jgi:hypothetical protein
LSSIDQLIAIRGQLEDIADHTDIEEIADLIESARQEIGLAITLLKEHNGIFL